MLTTLLQPDAGTRPGDRPRRRRATPPTLRSRIGLAGQYAAVDENLTGLENLVMVGRLYGKRRADGQARAADELLERFDLVEAAERLVKTYSGGMRRRLDLAAALVARPPVLFLDEPTTGLDPRSRLELWETIEGLVAEGTTVLLTTQYLDEADRLADRIAVIDRGRVIADGTADELKDRVGGERLEVHLADAVGGRRGGARRSRRCPTSRRSSTARPVQRPRPPAHRARSSRRCAASTRPASASTTSRLRRPTLDDVFLTLTGREPAEASRGGRATEEVAA